jgi:hypothetical protein
MNTYRNIHPYFSPELEMEIPNAASTPIPSIRAQNAELLKQLKADIELLAKYDFHKFYFTQKHSHFSEDF